MKFYTKQFLHDGEELFYNSSMDHNPLLEIGDEKISLAICADIEHSAHPMAAKTKNSTLYLASIFYSENGIDGGLAKLKNYAQKYSIHILMSNFFGRHWNTKCGGQSIFILQDGEHFVQLEKDTEGLLILSKIQNRWESEIIKDIPKNIYVS